jgi:hypothetical protein
MEDPAACAAANMRGESIALSQVLMNMVPRDSLGSSQYYGDEDSDVSPMSYQLALWRKTHGNLHGYVCLTAFAVTLQTKARCWLFLSYMISFAAVTGAGAVFVSSIQHHAHVQLGVVRDRESSLHLSVYTKCEVHTTAQHPGPCSAKSMCHVCRAVYSKAASSLQAPCCCGPSEQAIPQTT